MDDLDLKDAAVDLAGDDPVFEGFLAILDSGGEHTHERLGGLIRQSVVTERMRAIQSPPFFLRSQPLRRLNGAALEGHRELDRFAGLHGAVAGLDAHRRVMGGQEQHPERRSPQRWARKEGDHGDDRGQEQADRPALERWATARASGSRAERSA